MFASHQNFFQKLSGREIRLIKSLRLKKHRQSENAFTVEGTKSVLQLLSSSYTVRMLVGTPLFWEKRPELLEKSLQPERVFWTDKTTLTRLGALATNEAVLAIADIPKQSSTTPPSNAWGLVLDNLRDPRNFGSILRIADWYRIPAIVCAPNTVDLYNPKVIQTSMGSFLRVQVYYTPLKLFFSATTQPIWGALTAGKNLHHTTPPLPGWIVIGNESRGISPAVLAHVQRRISIPRYGQAESLSAAMATAILCDHWRQSWPGKQQ